MQTELTSQQTKRLLRLANIADGGELGIIQEINDLEDRIDELTITQKGDKGDKGDRGDDGKDGQDGVDGKNGKDGKDGRDGRDGRDGVDGKDGVDGRDGERGSDGQDFDPKLIEQLQAKIKELQKLIELNAGRNHGGEALPVTTTFFAKNGQVLGRAKNINFIEGSNSTIDVRLNGDTADVTIDSTGSSGGVQTVTGLNTDNSDPLNPVVRISVDGSTITGDGTPGNPLVATASANITVYTETPTGDVDGVNVSYTTLNTINSVLSFAINGDYIHPEEYGFSGTAITFVSPLPADLAGKLFTIVYI